MKILLKSKNLTIAIIDSLRFKRQFWIDQIIRYNNMEINDYDKKYLCNDAERMINECNSVLDAIGVD